MEVFRFLDSEHRHKSLSVYFTVLISHCIAHRYNAIKFFHSICFIFALVGYEVSSHSIRSFKDLQKLIVRAFDDNIPGFVCFTNVIGVLGNDCIAY